MKKNIQLLLSCILFVAISKPVLASILPCNGTKEAPCIVQDTKKNTSDAKYFRYAEMMAKEYKGNTKGLKHSWISGSAAPSAKGFKTIIEQIKKITNKKVKNIIDVDLRQESHVYLNNNAINLTTQYNWINQGKTDQEALVSEENWLNSLAQQSSVSDVLTPDQFKLGQFSEGTNIPVQSLENEKRVAENVGLQYIRLMVSDHMAPNDETVDKFVDLVKTLPPQTWLHVHCRGGAGRSTTFMALYDMLKNADRVSFNDIINRQAAVSPYYNLFDIDRKDPNLTIYYKKRLQFLAQFYQFATDSLRGYAGNWSDWIKDPNRNDLQKQSE